MSLAAAVAVLLLTGQKPSSKVGQVFTGSVVRVISPTRLEVIVWPFENKKKAVVRFFGLRNPSNPESYRDSIAYLLRHMDVPDSYNGQLLLEWSFETKRVDRDGTLAVTMTGEIWDHMDMSYNISEYSVGESLLEGGIAKLNPRESTGMKGFVDAARKGREEGRGMWARFR